MNGVNNFKEEAHELIDKYSKKLEMDIAIEDNMLEDKADFNNELLGFNLHQDKNDSNSSANLSIISVNTGKRAAKI